MKRQTSLFAVVMAAGFALAASTLWANNVAVTNVTFVNTDTGAGTTDVQFDLSWENSWRASWTELGVGVFTNWDAVWMFVKYRRSGGAWSNAWLTASGHKAPAGTMIDVGANGGVTNVGAFIYRSAEGHGNENLKSVRLRWNYATNGLSRADQIDVSVHAIEMVYIPQGNFYVGDGTVGEIRGQFEVGTNGLPFLITNEAYAITLGGGSAGSLGNHNTAGMNVADDFNNTTPQTLPVAFPKGYNAFYCMKYEITQGQYTDFLNKLTSTQAGNRFFGNTGSIRNTIGGSWPNYTNGAPDRAANFMGWADLAAYTAWAGLRPMTELEFEKACRGPKAAIVNEYAWGDVTVVGPTGFIGVDGSGTETATPATANANGTATIPGGLRVGLYATNGSTRAQAGAGYYGAMELSGNVIERPVTVGNATGRAFTGVPGNGILNTNGDAVVASWPGTGAVGAVARGGSSRGDYGNARVLRTSDRSMIIYGEREYNSGGRAVRMAP